MDEEPDCRRATMLSLACYVSLGIFVMTEKFGLTTNDTRLELTVSPRPFLASQFSLWDPRVSLGQLQNQAYGYLFPQGPWYVLTDLVNIPGWVSERLWSWALIVLACEGARRVCRALSLNPYAALAGGLAYALNPRMMAEVGVRSAEILPAVALPWALLPIILVLSGRLRPVAGALLSAGAFACGGGTNGTATAAPSGLLMVVVVWACWTHRLRLRAAVVWVAAMATATFWWAVPLVVLGAYIPPFFDYVEDARTTTDAAGFANAFRGTSNWIHLLTVDGESWWPSGYEVSLDPWLVAASSLLAALGLVGLCRYRGELRTPLLLGAALGLACISAAHVGAAHGPLAPTLRELLDGPLIALRNVAKADPVLRLPLAVGVAVAVQDLLDAARTRVRSRRGVRPRWAAAGRRVLATAVVVGSVACLGISASPVLDGYLRIHGWKEVPDYWPETARYLAASDLDGAAWIVPGAGFAIQDWGWTIEEPMDVLARSSWVTRSQVPLTPGATIRMLSDIESYLETGSGSPYLRNMLERIDVDRVVVRHDLDTDVAGSTPSSLVSLALARSPGIERTATFGKVEFGPAIEVFEVQNSFGGRPTRKSRYVVRDMADAVTVSASVDDAITAVGAGLVGESEPMLVRDGSDWDGPADIQGDQLRRRERAFGRVHDAESNVLTADEPYRVGRVVPDYPAPAGSQPVVARYTGIAGVEASSSAGFADAVGPVRPETAPWSALDGDVESSWTSAPYQDPVGQWLEVQLGRSRAVTDVTLQAPTESFGRQDSTTWRVSAGDASVVVTTDQSNAGRVVAHLGGVRASRLRVAVVGVANPLTPVDLSELSMPGLDPQRTLRVPEAELSDTPYFLFNAAPEARACVTTLLGPDCDVTRRRSSEESVGMDREITIPADGTWAVTATVVARSRPGTVELLRPLLGTQGSASSWLQEDPTVSARMAFDRDPLTSWIADPADRTPTFTFDFGKVKSVTSIAVGAPGGVASRPTFATIRAGGQTRVTRLSPTGHFKELSARSVSVTFARPGDLDYYTLGASEIGFPPRNVSVPLDGSVATGSVCGLGPVLRVDGVDHPTFVRGLVGSVVANGQLTATVCDGRVSMTAGTHRVQMLGTEQFQPVSLRMRPTAGGRPPAVSSRFLVERDIDASHAVLGVSPGEEAILSTPQSINRGWTATLDGERLRPLVVDGWAQGWVIPADAAGDVVLDYAPEQAYRVLLVLGLCLLGILLLACLVILALTRFRPSVVRPSDSGARAPVRDPIGTRRQSGRFAVVTGLPGRVPQSHGGATAAQAAHWLRCRTLGIRTGMPSRRRLAIAPPGRRWHPPRIAGHALVVVAAAGVLGGPVIALAALGGATLGRRRLIVQYVVLGLLAAALVVQLTELDTPQVPSDTVDLLTGGAFTLAIVAALLAGPRARRGSP